MFEPKRVIGWDVGGAHVKACLVEDGRVRDAAQWPCPLWQGQQHLDAAIGQARTRWAEVFAGVARHAVTMTGEMVDLFESRRVGVLRLADQLAARLGERVVLWAATAPGWVACGDAAAHWQAIASANWLATAAWAAQRFGDGVLVDVGSTTTDLVALRGGRPAPRGTSDAQRLSTGELVYLGVVRTPLCVLARHVPFDGTEVNVMNEFFATTADVHRLGGELEPEHDQQPSADGAPKDADATRQRLARMIGRDAADASPEAWLALARFWRDAQLDRTAEQLTRVLRDTDVPDAAPLVACGSGAFLAHELARRTGRPLRRFTDAVPFAEGAGASLRAWAEVCAPAAAVALLAAQA